MDFLRRHFSLVRISWSALIAGFHLTIFVPDSDRDEGVSVGDNLVLGAQQTMANPVFGAFECGGRECALGDVGFHGPGTSRLSAPVDDVALDLALEFRG